MSDDEHPQLDFDPLDATRGWPEGVFPLRPVGMTTLDRNVTNFHLENEQLALGTGNLVDGIARTPTGDAEPVQRPRDAELAAPDPVGDLPHRQRPTLNIRVHRPTTSSHRDTGGGQTGLAQTGLAQTDCPRPVGRPYGKHQGAGGRQRARGPSGVARHPAKRPGVTSFCLGHVSGRRSRAAEPRVQWPGPAPVAVEWSMPSRRDRSNTPRSVSVSIVRITLDSDRPNRSSATTTTVSPARTWSSNANRPVLPNP